jgi:hypothetical protein
LEPVRHSGSKGLYGNASAVKGPVKPQIQKKATAIMATRDVIKIVLKSDY